MKWIAWICCMLGILSACKGKMKQVEYESVDVGRFEQLLTKPDVQLLDVRTGSEYVDGHIAGALNLDVSKDSFVMDCVKTLDKQKLVLVYCRSGKRSEKAAVLLAGQGYRVVNLSSGFLGWTAAGKTFVY